MKKVKSLLVSVLTASALVAQGPATAGGAVAGATEITQIMNNLQLIMQYEQQVQSYVRQGLQLQNELTNLMKNPTSVLGPEVGQMINTIGKIWTGANTIGYNLAQIDSNFDKMFKSPQAGNYARMFTSWHETNTNTLQSALKAIGTQRENYASSQAALADLYNRSQATNGNLDALQTLSQINIRQIQELQSLQELMSSQAQAATTYMAAQNAKDQKQVEVMNQKYDIPIPSFETGASPKWKNFGK